MIEGRLKVREAASLLELSRKQMTRLCQAYKRNGAAGIVSRKRGRPSNRKTGPAIETRAVQLVRELYGDFGPTLAREKLAEKHIDFHLRLSSPSHYTNRACRRHRPSPLSQQCGRKVGMSNLSKVSQDLTA